MITFQHRHYCKIAKIISDLPTTELRELVAAHFTNELRGTNPNYDSHRFYTAAKGEPSSGRDSHSLRWS